MTFTNNKAIFLDRDGTINIDRDYVYRIQDFEFIPNAPESLKLLQDAGYLLIIITNQSGIARGYYTEDDYKILNDWMLKTLADEYMVHVTASYYCPHHPEAVIPTYRIDCNCRKPKLGLFERAIKDFNIDLSSSYAIGDKLRDLAICERRGDVQFSKPSTYPDTSNLSDIHSIDRNQNYSGCRGFLIGDKESGEVIRRVKAGEMANIRCCDSLYEATKMIVSKHQPLIDLPFKAV